MANPNIALTFKSPQFRSPLDTAARAQQIASNAMAMQKSQREGASLNALRDYVRGGGSLGTPEDINAAIQAGADPDTVRALAAQNLEVGKATAERKKIDVARVFNRLPAVDRAGELGNDQAWVDWLGDYGKLGKEEAAEAAVYLNLTGGKYDPATVKGLMAGAEKYFQKTTPQAQAEVIQNAAGDFYEARVGGVGPGGAYKLEEYEEDQTPKNGTVTVEPSVTVEPGVGGPDETSPAQQLMLNLASVRDDAGYQTILSALDRADPMMARRLRAVAPRFNPTVLARVVKEANTALGNGAPQITNELVIDQRGGMGGPLEGYVSTGRQLRGRIPAPPSQPQPRETAEEVFRKEAARLEAQRLAKLKAGPPPPAPLTEAQRLARRDKMAAAYSKAQALINKTFDPKVGIVAAANKVKALSQNQKEAVTGWSTYAPSIRESSRLADAALSDIKGIVIDLGKSEASDDGGIGNMAVQEWGIVANMIASLDFANMTPAVLDRQMNIIERRAVNAADLTKQAYEARFGEELKTNPQFKLRMPTPPKTRTPVNKGGSKISPDVDNILKGLGI